LPKLIPSSQPVFPPEDIPSILTEIGEVLRSGQFRNGKNVKAFEAQVAQYIHVREAVAFDSDSSAYETALRFFEVQGREVVVCTNSFISVPNSVVFAGGKVVFADINPDTLSMDPNSLEQNLSANTCGVIVTHIAGFPNPALQQIQKICKAHNLFLIEDATHAIGATVHDKKVGSLGDAAVFAFTPTKVITTGEGGMLVSNNAELCEFATRYRFYGSGQGKTNFVDVGRHMVLPEISALLGLSQLNRLDKFITRRNQIAEVYDEAFAKNGAVKAVTCPTDCRCSYYKYPLILSAKINPQQFIKTLLDVYGIETGSIFYPPCHMQTVYRCQDAILHGHLMEAEDVLSRTVALPMHVALSADEVAFIAEKVGFLTDKLH